MTPHISAKKNDIAKIVLMPGDPLRAKWIAENFLDNYKLVSEVRGMYCYTGTYKGKKISVMGHGMGIPSIGIYSYELYNFYNVDLIIRVGSSGSYSKDINLGDIILVDKAYSESTYAKELGLRNNKIITCPSKDINNIIYNTSNEMNKKITIGTCHSADAFYSKKNINEIIRDTNSICVEMEAYGLFANAKKLNKKAAVLLTCSDSLITKESMNYKKRQTSFKDMIHIALESILKIK